MGFFAPWFLAGLAAIGLPVYIHLLLKHTATPRPVSSLMFFERGTQSSTKHRRLRYLLLFSLRALLLLLLALVFANPFIRRSTASANDKLLVVVVDNSFSMGQSTRLQDAKQHAIDLLTKRPPAQRAQIMQLSGDLQVLTQPIQDTGALKSAVEGIQPGDAHGNFGELGRGMRALAETVHTPIELHLFSDMQASNMPGNFADMVLPGNVVLALHGVAARTIPNWTVESVDAPGQLVDPKRAKVVAVIAGHDTPAATRTVSLLVNGTATITKKVDVPANGRATVAFDSLDVPYGASKCEVKIDNADAFAADDSSIFAVKRADPERVLFVHTGNDQRSPLYFGTALAAAAQASFVLQPISVEQSADSNPTKYAFVVLSDVASIPSLLENNLTDWVRNGGNLLIALGSSQSRKAKIPVFGGNILDEKLYSRSGGFSTIGQMDESHPALKSAGGWQDMRFYYASVIDPGNARVVARLADGTPLLIDKQIGSGHVLLLTSGLDNVTNDLPLHPAFVAFVDQASRYLSGAERLSGARVVDSFIQLRSATDIVKGQSASVEVIGPDGKRPLTLQEEATVQSYQLSRAGFYQLRFASGKDALVAVNPDRRESGLAPILDDTLKLWSGGAATNAPAANVATNQQEKSRESLWWWVMLFILVAAVFESVIASRYLGTQREAI